KKRPVPKLSFGTGRCNLTSPRASVMFRDRRLLAWINRFTCNARLKKQPKQARYRTALYPGKSRHLNQLPAT
ncbi:hypothetical protein, partial [Pseudomonas syringae]|uniref:hypothetical protein n=1 Tax=Pseudomonas syringae TaxID=317 RepID=UPI001E4F5482